MTSEQQVEAALKSYEDVDSWKTIIFLYNAALKEVGTKLEILNDEFQHVHQYNPIEHIKTRIKTLESIVKKLRRYGMRRRSRTWYAISMTLRGYVLFVPLHLIFTVWRR